MNWQEIWHNGSKRLLVVLIIISGFILLVVACVAVGIFYLSFGLDKVNKKVESVSDKQGEIVTQVEGNTISITNLSESVNEGWQTFQKQNPTQPIPQIADVQSVPDGQTEVVIKPPLSSPRPTPLPKEKTRTVIKYRTRPTPTPFRFFGIPKKK